MFSMLTNALEIEIHTQIVLANSERDAEKRLELMYSDKQIEIKSCKYVW